MAQVMGPFPAHEPEDRPAGHIPVENYWYQRRRAAYRWAATLVAGADVLDLGPGDGGDLLANASSVVGRDVEDGSARELPYPDSSFDAVIAVQVIAHVSVPRELVAECARVLRPGGLAILSTPNGLRAPRRSSRHAHALSPDELIAVLGRSFEVEILAGIHHTARIRLLERLARKPFAERLVDQPAPEWPRWLRRAVAKTAPDDFAIRTDGLPSSLEILAAGRRR